MKTVVILPTYNEKENIEKFIGALLNQFKIIESELGMDMHILVVDDYSPDGTGDVVNKLIEYNSKINLIQNNVRGLGNAYIKGFQYSINEMHADVCMEMDSDFSHNPKDVIRLLKEINNGYDLVIGSRYVAGGSIPDNWSLFRKMNSYWGNFFSRYITGVSAVRDCTSGFRAIKTDILKKIDLSALNANGYFFQLKLLFVINQKKAKIIEIPIEFIDRELGESKLGLKDIIEFIIKSVYLRISVWLNKQP